MQGPAKIHGRNNFFVIKKKKVVGALRRKLLLQFVCMCAHNCLPLLTSSMCCGDNKEDIDTSTKNFK